MRKLVTVRRISEIMPIPGADAIECAQVDGWKVVVKKGEFQAGQLAAYYEIDSWIPEDVAPFLCKDKREFNGVPGARLRTIKLRGQVSQGLLLPVPSEYAEEGDDLTEVMGVQKWEAPIAPQLAGQVRGSFPAFLKKTDQERVQNLRRDLEGWIAEGHEWEVTEKLDGSSMTVYLNNGDFGVCSRNLDLKQDEKNSFWAMALALRLEDKMRAHGENIAIQGELIGPGIQGNKYGLSKHEFHVFDVFSISDFSYKPAAERHHVAEIMGLKHCPVLNIGSIAHDSMDDLIAAGDGESRLNGCVREGLVFKSISDPDISFKVISNKFLLAEAA